MRRWLVAVVSLFWGGATLADEVSVAVAANFSATFERLAERFAATTGHTAVASYGATGALYAQIMNGAPYELLLSADAERPAKLVEQGKAVAATRRRYAVGRLVLWSRDPDRIGSEGERLLRGLGGRVAIANPAISPYGLAAEQTLVRLGQWAALQKGMVRGQNIAQTFQFAVSGSVDVAFVALSQIRQGDWVGRGSYWLVPEGMHDPIGQEMVLLARGKNSSAATALLQFIGSDEGRKIIRDGGYGLP